MIILNSKKSAKSLSEAVQVHLNPPQLMSYLLGSNKEVVIAGRATGKTYAITALKLANWADSMPRSVLRLTCYTYEGLKTNVLPGIIQGWEEILGYKEGTDDPRDGGRFWVEKDPPKKFKIHKPYRNPRGNVKYQIRWWNGTVILLSSMDRAINVGGEFDAIAFEEGKHMKRKPYTEIIQARRGNKERFKHLSQYGSSLMVTDRPEIHDDGRWILEEAEKITPEINKYILQTCGKIAELYADINEAEKAKHLSAALKLRQEVTRYEGYLNQLRMNSFNYVEISTLENIHALGIRVLIDYYNNLDPYEYSISVLTKEPDNLPNRFYAMLNKDVHGYSNINYSYIDNLEVSKRSEVKRDVNWYNDTNLNDKLYIGFDHNAIINNVVTAQIMGKNAYFLSDLHVDSPEYLSKLIDRWDEFYSAHRDKTVVFCFNSTSIGDDSRGNPSEHQVVIDALRSKGWNVIPRDLGRVPEHRTTHKLWAMSLQGHHPDLLGIRMNMQACERLFNAMKNTKTRRVGEKVKKDKRSEILDYKTGKYPVHPKDATHVTEAADTVLLGMQRDHYSHDLAPLISSFGFQSV